MHYKATDDSQPCGFSVHYLDDDNFLNLLPEGSIPITDEEAETICAANTPQSDPVQLVKDQIEAIERQTMMNRAIREGWLLLVEREAMREYSTDLETAQSGLYSGNLAYRKVKDIDNQIAALRAQIGVL